MELQNLELCFTQNCRGHLVQKDLLDFKDHRVLKEILAHVVILDSQETKVPVETQVILEVLVFQDKM